MEGQGQTLAENKSPIFLRIVAINEFLSMHNDSIKELHSRLSPVLEQPAPETTKGEPAKELINSELERQLTSIANEINSRTSFINDIIQRLQI